MWWTVRKRRGQDAPAAPQEHALHQGAGGQVEGALRLERGRVQLLLGVGGPGEVADGEQAGGPLAVLLDPVAVLADVPQPQGVVVGDDRVQGPLQQCRVGAGCQPQVHGHRVVVRVDGVLVEEPPLDRGERDAPGDHRLRRGRQLLGGRGDRREGGHALVQEEQP